MANSEINFLGETTFRNQERKFGIKKDDRRRHVYIIGKTGMGKTALLENMVIQDIRAGKGIGFIDPHGDAAEKLLDFIPSSRVNDVVYFNPSDQDFPIPFNVMEKVGAEYKHLVASGLMDVFKKIWPDVWSARMEYILNNCVLALLETPDSTLLGVNRMMSDPDYRAQIVERVKDPVVRSFWVNEFARYSQKYETEATAAIQNKIGQLIANPLIRNIVGQVKSKLDMRAIMDEGKIFIVNLSKGKIGEDNSKLLGALIITKLQLAAMSRVNIAEEKRRDFFLYVDEFQNFVTDAFASILSEARKYRLCLTLANQYIAQLEEMTALGKSSKVKDAVFGNVGTIVVFRIGAEDAEFLEKEFTPELTTEDLVNLEKYNIYLKLMIDGVSGRPFSARTLPPFSQTEESHKEKIIKVARERYGIARTVVEEKILKWTGDLKQATFSVPSQQGLYDAVCSMCKKNIKVVFAPEPGRNVYCKSCLKKIREQKKREKEKRTETPQQRKHKISLEEMKSADAHSFSKKPAEREKPEREKKEVDIEALKKNLEKALKKTDEKDK